jgi:DNA (cytosine-5)-methyltransferase 1
MRPLAVDLYCCQGGASRGFDLAGFDLLGVDKDPQPLYPYEFVQADALVFLSDLIGAGMTWRGRPVRLVAGSPPCQRRTKAQKIRGREHPKLIAPTRELMIASGVAYVIENVPAEGIDDDPLIDPVKLCGAMFGLHTYRHRLFESSMPLTVPLHPRHLHPTVKMGRPVRDGDWYHAVGNFNGGEGYVKRDMGVTWMNRDGARESIPPVYTQFIGAQLLRHLAASEVTA